MVVGVAPVDRDAGVVGNLGAAAAQVELLAVGAGAVEHRDGVLLLMVAVLGAAVAAH